jgi:hypothetical protein
VKRIAGFSVRVTAAVIALVLVAFVGTTVQAGAKSPGSGSHELVGLFRLSPGTFDSGKVGGTWFRMLQPDATVKNGPYMVNADSSADGGLATLLQPGTEGGFRTGSYQPQPTPAFDSGGNSLAGAITVPTEFFGVKFSISTNKIDPQTKTACAPPIVEEKNGKLTADLSSWAASWNKQNFNQGAPKPVRNTGAKSPGQRQAQQVWDYVSKQFLGSASKATITGPSATGTFDPKTGAFVLQWTSLIVGGPFNGFTGLWHLEGVFQSSGRTAA